jgi:DtxR family Mn-dependent transcriptional regulator
LKRQGRDVKIDVYFGRKYYATLRIRRNVPGNHPGSSGKKKGSVRSIDVATKMGFSKASISRAMGILKKDKYITIEPDGEILFTDAGLKIASGVFERHKTLTRFFVDKLDIPEDIAEKDACRIEHIISPETFAGIKRALKPK